MVKVRAKGMRMSFLNGLMALALAISFPVLSYANSVEASAQQGPVKGVVVDESGNPMPGVGVFVKGTTNGVVSDIDGNFSINCRPTDILVFSSVGFSTLELPANSNLSRVVIREDAELLDEVIVIGYGTTTRKSATGSVESVRTQVLENRPVRNVAEALQGAAANVVIQRTSYDPNNENGVNFNIRGLNSTNSNTPLFVIDGIVTDMTSFNNLNPNDIENISVLKDAGTAAIYGSRSAAGVILVTTKKGKKNEKTRVRFSALMGVNKPNVLAHPVKGWENAMYYNESFTNVGQAPKFSQAQIDDLKAHVDDEQWWYTQLFDTATVQKYNASVSGGSEKTTYMLSVGYEDTGSNYVSDTNNFGAQRYNMRANITTELGPLTITGIMAYTRRQSLSPQDVSIANAVRVPPYYYYNALSPDGTRYLINDVVNDFTPFGQLNSGSFNKDKNNAVTLNLNGELKVTSWLKLRGIFGVNLNNNYRFFRYFPQTYWASADATEPRSIKMSDYRSGNTNSDSYRTNGQFLVDANKTFGQHNVYGMLGVTNESYTYEANDITKKYVDPTLGVATSTTTGEAGNITGGTAQDNNNKTSIWSFIGRAGYNYADRYYAEFSFRYDGSSKFHEDVRWGFFPSVSAGWRISQENFMENYRTNVGDLKIRGSWGILGSQAIGNYEYYTKYNVSGAHYGYEDTPATSATFSIGNKDLTWEKTYTLNLGLDASFFKNTLNLTFDYFRKKTTDILAYEYTPSVFGTSLPRTNVGEMENKGWEFTLSYNLKADRTFHTFSFNIADSKNKVTKYPGADEKGIGSITHTSEVWKVIQIGIPYGAYFGYRTDGLFQSEEEIAASAKPSGIQVYPGDVKYKDLNNDGVIDDEDREYMGYAFPRYTFGFTYNFEWNGFDLTAFFQGVGKRTSLMRGELMEPFHENYSYVIFKHQLNYWTPENRNTKKPRLAAQGSSSDTNNFSKNLGSDLFMLNMRYIRLKNLAIGYTLPRNLTKKVGMNKCRIYVNGQDLFTLCPHKFFDPEVTEYLQDGNFGTSGNNGRVYSSYKYFGGGIDIEF